MMGGETAALIGERIRAAREERGWTRRKLVGEMAGLATENDVYRWETGKHRPRDDALAAAAKALGRPLAWFMEADRGETPDLSLASDDSKQLEERLDGIVAAITVLGLQVGVLAERQAEVRASLERLERDRQPSKRAAAS